MDQQARILEELHLAIDRLADAVADRPPVACAIRRFADVLPEAARTLPAATAPRDPTAIRGLLYRALDAGALDARGFDRMMLARDRVARSRRPALTEAR
jgi:hypothetical protein